jgi:hypothetical protein
LPSALPVVDLGPVVDSDLEHEAWPAAPKVGFVVLKGLACSAAEVGCLTLSSVDLEKLLSVLLKAYPSGIPSAPHLPLATA